jgi:hypothetical protein
MGSSAMPVTSSEETSAGLMLVPSGGNDGSAVHAKPPLVVRSSMLLAPTA